MIESAMWDETGKMIKVTMTDGTVMWVPDDMANRHRQELEEWQTQEGGTIQAYVPEAPPA